MTAPDPRLDEIQARLDAATPGPWEVDAMDAGHSRFDMNVWITAGVAGDTVCDMDGLNRSHNEEVAKDDGYADATFIAAAPADVRYLLAELRKARRAAQTLGQVIDKQCLDVLDVTGLHHLINKDGDGAWDVVWMRLFEMREELKDLKESTIGRERLRGDSWRDRAQETAVRLDDAAEDLRKAHEALAAVDVLAESWRYKGEFGWGAWQEGHGPDMEGTILDNASTALRAAVAAAKGDEAHVPGASAAECPCQECRECCATFAPKGDEQ